MQATATKANRARTILGLEPVVLHDYVSLPEFASQPMLRTKTKTQPSSASALQLIKEVRPCATN
jgi:hypothetical protein